MSHKPNNQVERAITILDKSPVVAVFSRHKDLLFHFRKTERIVAALYIITSTLSDREPIKYEMRALATELIREVLSLRILSQDEKKTREVTTLIARLVSLFDLADISDLLPSAHLSPLKKELILLLESIERRGSGGLVSLQSSMIPESFFDSPSLFNTSKGHPVSSKNVLYDSKERQKESVLDGDLNPSSPKGRLSRATAIRDGRKSRILALLREKGSIVIKDISSVIRDCSKKSLQRLLSDLVQVGVLQVEGEKRWTRYTLKSGQKV